MRMMLLSALSSRDLSSPGHFVLREILTVEALRPTSWPLPPHWDDTHNWQWVLEKLFLIDSCYCSISEDEEESLLTETARSVFRGDMNGTTSIYGNIVCPVDFDSSKKYPMLERIYAGPQNFYTPKAFQDLTKLHSVANQGHVVVCVDGIGTNWRSKAFHDACYKNLKDAGFAYRIAWMRTAAESRPWIDLSRLLQGCGMRYTMAIMPRLWVVSVRTFDGCPVLEPISPVDITRPSIVKKQYLPSIYISNHLAFFVMMLDKTNLCPD
ncbi:prolyl oligopeptidase family protein [Hirsutella rhossiliensis]